MKKINNVHDKFFKRVFSNSDITKDLILHFVSKEIVKRLNLDTLKITSESYVNDNLEEYLSDLVFTCRLRNGKGNQTISLLIEHKANNTDGLVFQLAEYLLNGYRQELNHKKKPHVIVPILLYHGTRKLKKTTISDVVSFPDVYFQKFLLNFDYEIIDISLLSQSDIFSFHFSSALRNALMLLRYAWDKEYLVKNIESVFSLIWKYKNPITGENFFKWFFVYYIELVELPKKEFSKIVKKLSDPLKDFSMSTYDMIVRDAKKEGKLELKREMILNMLKEKFDLQIIAKVANTTVSFVKKLKKELEKTGEL